MEPPRLRRNKAYTFVTVRCLEMLQRRRARAVKPAIGAEKLITSAVHALPCSFSVFLVLPRRGSRATSKPDRSVLE
jgi:hypothetical protein